MIKTFKSEIADVDKYNWISFEIKKKRKKKTYLKKPEFLVILDLRFPQDEQIKEKEARPNLNPTGSVCVSLSDSYGWLLRLWPQSQKARLDQVLVLIPT